MSDSRSDGLQLWVGSPLVKLFRDSEPPTSMRGVARAMAARGGTATLQFGCRPTRHHGSLTCTVDPFETESGGPLEDTRVRYVGFVDVMENTPNTPAEEVARAAPALFPDPLFDVPAMRVRRGQTQPIWITVRIPRESEPGVYRSRLRVTDAYGGERSCGLVVEVVDVVLPRMSTLKVTNWFSHASIARDHGLDLYSEAYWRMLAVYARDLAAHRQNTVITPVLDLVRAHPGRDGKLTFRFERLDRFVEVFRKAGVIGLIEGGHLGGRDGGWEADHFAVRTMRIEDGRVVTGRARVGTEEAEVFLSQFLPAVQRYLERRGLLKRYVQHLADEPVSRNAASYNLLAAISKRYAPALRTVDANMCEAITDLDVWVPQLGGWHQNADFYEARRQAGDELWFYTCLEPTGRYANRFIDYPLLKTRLLHWINARYGATGYLHWGLNYWAGPVPYQDVAQVHSPSRTLPPGDAGIVYPGPAGPVDSIRFEAQRDGIEDYDVLATLANKRPEQADAFCRRVVRDFDSYELDAAKFARVRTALLRAAEAC